MRSLFYAVGGTGFAFVMTALGASLVFFLKERISDRLQCLCMGFAGGVMSAAAVFSLLVPAAKQAGEAAWLVVSGGFLLGAAAIWGLDGALQRRISLRGEARRQALVFSAMTLHNIPEGMAVGLAFALAAKGETSLAPAIALALGIGIQNLPEGAAIALPLCQSGLGRTRSFLAGVLSGAVEPLFGAAVVLAAASAQRVMPLLMAFSAGAMMLVVIGEMLPFAGSHRDGTAAAAAGYALMMALDIALG